MIQLKVFLEFECRHGLARIDHGVASLNHYRRLPMMHDALTSDTRRCSMLLTTPALRLLNASKSSR